MPEPAQFLAGFELYEGKSMSGYTILHISIQHITVKRYHHYDYPISITLASPNNNTLETMKQNL